ncbi:class I SAM-dependent methyltransferase [Luteibacter pinisoli]|uniref:Class I SAM-dependent methyltransferase n=1 Tax=Luteibacter pinisoli TaxID=2589080 RepID=A0A4Y5Z2F2_9GAMM|nr:class I SAM-dependent methyltransferase [Luteibacter pinisoli]QDE38789.1 class I SAM-dependent methyltransferase [Luteibacter pinisoli]
MSALVTSTWRGGAAEAVRSCPACGAVERSPHAGAVFDHLRPADDDLWTFWKCDACASLYPDPRPSMDSIGAAYSDYYTHHPQHAGGLPGSNGTVSVLSRCVDGYLNARFGSTLPNAMPIGHLVFSMIEPLRLKLDYHGRHLFLAQRTPGRVLDVGSGNGDFLLRARAMGWDARGIDPDPAAVGASRAQGLVVCVGFADCRSPELGGAFDVVTMRHSIEHVAHPGDDLRHCLGHLRPGGMLWLAWPNPQGVGARIFRSAWRGLEAPRHLCIPSAEAMRGLLLGLGFEAPRLIRRGHHARSIARESARIAEHRPGWLNRVRRHLGGVVAWAADMAATLSSGAGEELVMVAFAPERRCERD